MSSTDTELDMLNDLLKKFRFAMVTTRAEDGALHAHPLTVQEHESGSPRHVGGLELVGLVGGVVRAVRCRVHAGTRPRTTAGARGACAHAVPVRAQAPVPRGRVLRR
jgi:hypothetical protein